MFSVRALFREKEYFGIYDLFSVKLFNFRFTSDLIILKKQIHLENKPILFKLPINYTNAKKPTLKTIALRGHSWMANLSGISIEVVANNN